ncbi:hypothetical protein [Acinetobacter baumannii]|uniref:hypothetical protein n=1 Tax=Acinetobacter baumannii TaxID=470 RepID=UPI00294A6147|nr:hypothetical protein [Acinetobacter baumannii]MDV5703145.1 hypothetical protein [Acinetobacter baumannii]
MNSDKQYFDRLQEEYSEKYGHELYAIDDIEGKKYLLILMIRGVFPQVGGL